MYSQQTKQNIPSDQDIVSKPEIYKMQIAETLNIDASKIKIDGPIMEGLSPCCIIKLSNQTHINIDPKRLLDEKSISQALFKSLCEVARELNPYQIHDLTRPGEKTPRFGVSFHVERSGEHGVGIGILAPNLKSLGTIVFDFNKEKPHLPNINCWGLSLQESGKLINEVFGKKYEHEKILIPGFPSKIDSWKQENGSYLITDTDSRFLTYNPKSGLANSGMRLGSGWPVGSTLKSVDLKNGIYTVVRNLPGQEREISEHRLFE